MSFYLGVCWRRRFLPALVVSLLVSLSTWSDAQNLDVATDSLTVLWSAPSPFKETSRVKGAVLIAATRLGDDLAILLDKRDGGHPFLMIGTDVSGPGKVIPVSVPGWSARLAKGPGDTFWIAGLRNPRRSPTGPPLSNAYLAKINRDGQVIWERQFGDRSESSIQSLIPLPSSGDVVVAGQYNDRTVVARIAAEGHIVWERLVGVGKGSSIALVGGRIFLTAFGDARGNRPSPSERYQDDVGLWIFNDEGRLLEHRVIREGVNNQPGDRTGRLMVMSSGEGAYLFSLWSGFDHVKPLEVVKVSHSGQPVWRRELSETVVQFRNRTSLCSETIAVLGNGDPLVGCARSKGIQLIRLDAQTGQATEKLVQMPSSPLQCNGRWPFGLLTQIAGDVVGLFGANNDCTWLGRVSFVK